jgi:cytochrome c-type biogenesis protein CcmH/NrfF
MHVFVLAAVLAALAADQRNPVSALAQGPSDTTAVRARDDTEAQRLFGQLMSPFCPGLTLAACPSPGADSLRRDIRERLSGGETPRSVVASYAADWGEQMLGAPPVRDWGAVLWLAPGVLLTLGAIGLTLWLRTERRRVDAAETADAAPAQGPGPPDEPALKARLEAELKEYGKVV